MNDVKKLKDEKKEIHRKWLEYSRKIYNLRKRNVEINKEIEEIQNKCSHPEYKTDGTTYENNKGERELLKICVACEKSLYNWRN